MIALMVLAISICLFTTSQWSPREVARGEPRAVVQAARLKPIDYASESYGECVASAGTYAEVLASCGDSRIDIEAGELPFRHCMAGYERFSDGIAWDWQSEDDLIVMSERCL